MKNITILLLLLVIFGCKNDSPKEETSEKQELAITQTEFDPYEIAGQDYFLDDQHSYIGFKIKYFGFSPVRGRFNTFNGSAFYHPDAVGSTQMTLFIDVNSINTGNERRDKDLITGTGWFNETEFPHISFRSKNTKVNEDGSFQLSGDFTMNGVSREIEIPFEKPTNISRDYAANEQVDYSGKLTINRKDYGVIGDDFWDTVLENGLTQLSDEVEIELDIHTRRGDYLKRFEELEYDNVRKIVLDAFQENGLEAGMAAITTRQKAKDNSLTSGALTTIGKTLIARKKYDEALAVFQNASNYFPEKALHQINIAITYLLKKDGAKALQFFNIAMEMDPTNATAAAYLDLLSKTDSQ